MVKQLLKSVREFKKDALLTPFFVVLEVVMEVLIPFVMAELIDKGIDAQNMSAIGKYGFILVACAMLALVFGAAAGTYAARASTGFARNLRHDMYYAVQDFSFSNIDKFSTGSIVTRLTTDVTNVQNAFQMCTRIAVRCPVMLIFAFVMAAKINRNMALIFVAVLPVLAIGLGILMKMVGPVFERVFKIYDRLNTVVQENVRGIRVVKTYAHAVLHVCVHAARLVVRRASDRERFDDDRRADQHVLLYHADPDESDDGRDGFRHDHDGEGERRTSCGAPERKA